MDGAGESGYARLLAEQAAEADVLARDVRARAQERWQLHNLLAQKNRQLQYEVVAAKRYRRQLAHFEDRIRFYVIFDVFCSWAGCVHQSASRRAVAQIKARLVEFRLRQSCFRLVANLSQAVGRVLGPASRAVRLFAAAQTLDSGSFADPVEEMPEDQVLFATPRSPSSCFARRGPHTLSWRGCAGKSAKLGAPSLVSEATTSAPASSSVSVASSARTLPGAAAPAGATGTAPDVPQLLGTGSSLFNQRLWRGHLSGATCLVVALHAAMLGRLFWATSRIRSNVGANSAAAPASSTVAADVDDGFADGLVTIGCTTNLYSSNHSHPSLELVCRGAEPDASEKRSDPVPRRLQQQSSDYDAEITSLVNHRDNLALRAAELARTQKVLAARLDKERKESSHFGLGGHLASGSKFSAARADSCEAAAALLVRLQAVQHECEHANTEETQVAHRLSESARRTGTLKRTATRLEVRVARETDWREEATEQIVQMVARGEQLEGERSRLLQRHAEAQDRSRIRYDESYEMRRALVLAEKTNEELESCTLGLDRENLRLLGAVEDERGLRMQLRRRCDDSVMVAQKTDLWKNKVDQASKEVVALQQRLCAAQLAEEAEAAAAADMAHHVEVATCSRLAEEVAQSAAKVERLGMEHTAVAPTATPCVPPLTLTCLQASAPSSLVATSITCNSVFATPRSRQSRCSSPRISSASLLDELDAYAALVHRLRSELEREREERDASTRSIANLRSSYNLLLQRGGVFRQG